MITGSLNGNMNRGFAGFMVNLLTLFVKIPIPPDSYVTLQNYGNKIINSFKLKPPFLFPPRGKGFFAPSPLGEGWEGGSLIKKITLKAQIRNSLNCYMNSEEIHSYRDFPHEGR
jgi:hypothetical protein